MEEDSHNTSTVIQWGQVTLVNKQAETYYHFFRPKKVYCAFKEQAAATENCE